MKNCKEINIKDRINLIYIYLFFSIKYNTFIYLVCIINSISKVVKDWFQAQFNLVLLQGSKIVKNNNKDINLFVIYNHYQAITTAKKEIWDYYIDLVNRKLLYKYI